MGDSPNAGECKLFGGKTVNRRMVWAVLALILTAFVAIAHDAATEASVTVDEFAHLPVGYRMLSTRNFDAAVLNPPLMNLISALPLRFMPAVLPLPVASGTSARSAFWAEGYAFMEANRSVYRRLFAAARWMTILVTVGLGVLVFFWARNLVPGRPEVAGLTTAGLILLEPNLIAHGSLITTDAGCAASFLLALFGLWRFVQRPGWGRAMLAGVWLGAALLVKFTAVYLVATHLLTLLWIAWRSREMPQSRFVRLVLGLYLAALFTVNAGYLFQKTGRPLGEYVFESTPLLGLQRVLPSGTPVLLPQQYVLAFDRQASDAAKDVPSYLFGTSYRGGRWYYFLVLAVFKIPLPLLLLILAAAVVSLCRRGLRGTDEVLLLLPAAVVLGAMSLASSRQIGLRMVLPSW